MAWETTGGADSYQVQIATDEVFTNLVAEAGEIVPTAYQVEGLEFETIYYWRVRGDNSEGPGEWSAVWSFTTEEEPLSPPAIVTLSSPEDGAVDVSVDPQLVWEPAAEATTYELELSLAEDFSTLVLSQDGISSTEFQLADLSFETPYFWRVRGVNEAGPGEWSAAWSFTTSIDVDETFRPFITTWITNNNGISNNNQIRIPMISDGYDFSIDWGDGNTETYSNDPGEDVEHALEHTYVTEGEYEVKISGKFPRIYFNNGGDRRKIVSVVQWGDIKWDSMEGAFYGAFNLEMNATDAPDLSNVKSLRFMFRTANKVDGDFSNWVVSNITTMEGMFWGLGSSLFNGNITNWDVSKVENMSSMFRDANTFNQDISGWEVNNVTNMSNMFLKATAFNQDIGKWNVGNVTDMSFMFSSTEMFNQKLDSWDVSSVINMEGMFIQAYNFNGDISTWNVSNVENMSGMFYRASSFNQNISQKTINEGTADEYEAWNVSNVTDMSRMFEDADAFNQDLNNWDVSNVKNMSGMFQRSQVFGENSFNGAITSWDVSKVEDMSQMFRSTTAFNQDIGAWNIVNVTNMRLMLDNSALSAENYDNTLIGWAGKNVQDNVQLGASGLEYCEGKEARQTLIDTYNWMISNDSEAADCDLSGGIPQTVELSSPGDGSIDISINPQLTWKPAEGASTYELELSLAEDFSTLEFSQDGISLTEFQLADLSYETPYFWRVRGVNEAGQGEWSSTWNFTTEGEPLSPPDIVQLSSPEDGATEISINPELAWDPAVDAGTYQVQLSTEDGFTSLTVDQSSITETQLQVENLNYEVLYYWRVRAVNEAGVGEWSSTWSFTTKEEPLAPPEIVTLSSPVDGATDVSNSLAFAWESSEGAESYLLQVSTDKSFTTLVAEESELEATEFQVGGLEFERTYFWRVLGINQAGQGEWSTVWTFTTEFIEPETPVNFVLNQQNEFPRLTWETSSTTSGHRFNIYRGVSPRALEVIETVDASVLTFIDNQIPEGIYFYSVSSISSGGSESQKTTALSFVNDNLQAEGTWKLTSVPVAGPVVEAGLTALYSYEEKYLRETGLTPLTGYWMKTRSFDTEEIFVNGLGLLSAEFNLEQGWNLIGSLSDSIHVDMILDPENILTETPIYIYESDSYVSTDYIVPNQGHWIFAEEAGTINTSIRNSFMLASEPNDIEVQSYTLSHQIEVQNDSDARLMIENGQSSTHLHIQYAPVEKSLLSAYYLPPLSPDPVLDVRVENNTSLLQSDMEKVFVETSDFPLKLTIESDINEVAAYRMHAYSNNEKSYSVDLIPGQVQRAVEEFDYFTLEQIAEDEIVRADQLISSYPNPFNPSTTIQFELAQTTQVKLEVFDVVGRRVSLLAAEQFQAGQHFVTFRADNLSSGIYFVRFQTPQTVNLWKITLMK
ncbi:MAG: BspA family leucine-rich repeat surface protein [Balneolaceae bacterium]